MGSFFFPLDQVFRPFTRYTGDESSPVTSCLDHYEGFEEIAFCRTLVASGRPLVLNLYVLLVRLLSSCLDSHGSSLHNSTKILGPSKSKNFFFTLC